MYGMELNQCFFFLLFSAFLVQLRADERQIIDILYYMTPKLCQRECSHHHSCNEIVYDKAQLMCTLVGTNDEDVMYTTNTDTLPTNSNADVECMTTICMAFEICVRLKTKAVCVSEDTPRDCKDVLKTGKQNSGQAVIFPFYPILDRVLVLCDMETNNGGYTVIQRRYDGSVDFAQDWNNYTHGFGFLDTEFWIGNDIIHQLTSLGPTSLLVHLHDHYGTFKIAHYDNFEVESESRKFQLHISGYSGTAGDSLSIASGTKFSTIDNDNDKWMNGNCVAFKGKGGWWFKHCTPSALNGQYCEIGMKGHQCNRWHQFESDDRGMAKTLLLIRRND